MATPTYTAAASEFPPRARTLPGLYCTWLWLVCARGNANDPTPPVSADLSLRVASDSAPRGIAGTDLLHRDG